MASGVHRKKTKRLAGRSSKVAEKLIGMGHGRTSQAVVVLPKLVVVLSSPYFPDSFQWLHRRCQRLYRPYPVFRDTFEFLAPFLKSIGVYKYPTIS
ncbi:hypothetical protein BHE74_00037054 [Ensete ventricosum]|nr:hypothetical protein GW17_00053762 [Ensete ventricosum]RWW56246.1 hypothetical protein BHE74_00037054 [Ensete ventricosum]